MVLHLFLFLALAFWVKIMLIDLSLEDFFEEWFSFDFLLTPFYMGIPLFIVVFISYCRVFLMKRLLCLVL